MRSRSADRFCTSVIGLRMDRRLTSPHRYIFLEICTGSDLFAFIAYNSEPRKGICEAEAKYIMYQLLLGLKYLHDRHVSHRGKCPWLLLEDLSLTHVNLDLKVNISPSVASVELNLTAHPPAREHPCTLPWPIPTYPNCRFWSCSSTSVPKNIKCRWHTLLPSSRGHTRYGQQGARLCRHAG